MAKGTKIKQLVQSVPAVEKTNPTLESAVNQTAPQEQPGDNGEPKIQDQVVSAEDLQNNPELSDAGVKEGEPIQIQIIGSEEEMEGNPGEGIQEPGSNIPPTQTANPARSSSDQAEQETNSLTPAEAIFEAVLSKVKPSRLANKLMDDLGAPEIYENSKGEFFTAHDLAVLSENGKKDLVRTHTKINSSE